ncbi:MAG: helix-turn-helix domain-containing protein [Lachnospiraceae bacterium]|nr:helix-turn-helix domain-containing protein [Lachnospiraceae bacterium]
MEQMRYMISDAANAVAVESHVLRYWEDELELSVPRNEMGHRYYTKENIEQFRQIKELKEKGYQLKAIKILIHNSSEQPIPSPHVMNEKAAMLEESLHQKQKEEQKSSIQKELPSEAPALQSVAEMTQISDAQRRMEQFQCMMTEIVRNALKDNNKDLGEEIGTEFSDRVLKEMNYLHRCQEEQEEERFKKLDELIRGQVKKKKRFKKERPA